MNIVYENAMRYNFIKAMRAYHKMFIYILLVIYVNIQSTKIIVDPLSNKMVNNVLTDKDAEKLILNNMH